MSIAAVLPLVSAPSASLRPWRRWRAYFERQARRPLPATDADLAVPADVARVVAWSLARFQIGETGEGRVVGAVARTRLRGVDDDYRRALALFIAEEHRHATILGAIIRALGGRLLSTTWSQRLFVRARRLAGIRFKLLTMFAAEIVGIVFYRSLAEALPPSAASSALTAAAALVVLWDHRRTLRTLKVSLRTVAPRLFAAIREGAR